MYEFARAHLESVEIEFPILLMPVSSNTSASVGMAWFMLKLSSAVCLGLIGSILFLTILGYPVSASLCQSVNVSSSYPNQTFPNHPVQVITTVAGSCTSDGEDYFAVRVDLVDGTTKSILSSNSAPVGYNAVNFSAKVQNTAIAPLRNQTWPIEIDTYLIQAGGVNGKYLLNATSAIIQVGETPVPEFEPSRSFVLLLVLTGITLTVYRRKHPQEEETNAI